MEASVGQINAFLSKARFYLQRGKMDFIRGKEEKQTLSQLGISIRDAFALVYDLTVENYYRGPSADHKIPTESVWEFGWEEEPQDIYIKLKFRSVRDDLLMMSFHFANRPIVYPYKKRRYD
ncbi:type II toxin-antitoxin system MqsR family toxin [Risungbinella massiliensis]|uniref:type II toxin-antitoxin system MqsR family toxin n=1 Tax=Risungbinella massiliensis TaxID=1329796 RepID=UPI00069C1986|nr:type II toxin-antitoxin system MqsR family toxin [Risungbinella massiliensis]